MKRGRNSSGLRVFPEKLTAFCIEAMLKCGLNEKDARSAAEVLVTTDTWGVYSHGTKSLRQYLKRMRAGGLNSGAVPEIIKEGPAWAIVDGHSAMAMVSSCLGMETAMRKAKLTGIGYAGVIHSSHFGAAGYYASLALREDMVGIAMSNSDPNMIVPGARGKVIGNSPFAYAVPAGKEKPVFLDIAMSTVAAGKVTAASFEKKKIPDTWLVDKNGIPTTDPSLYPLAATLSPMAGHKGYGLALMVEILAGVLTGAGVLKELISWIMDDPSRPTGHGHAFIAIDIGSIMPVPAFKERMDRVIRTIKKSPKAKGSKRIYLPGEKEWENRERALKQGMLLPEEVTASLTGLAEDLDLELTVFSDDVL